VEWELAGVCDTGTAVYGISEQTRIGVGRPFDGGGGRGKKEEEGRRKKRITRSSSWSLAMLARDAPGFVAGERATGQLLRPQASVGNAAFFYNVAERPQHSRPNFGSFNSRLWLWKGNRL
jgi:hypothetical protein